MAEQLKTGFFPGDRQPLYGSFHQAAGSPRAGVLIFPPFGEERKCAARLLYLTACELARHSFDVLRFDYSGTGESLGEHAAATMENWLADGRSALACLQATSAAQRWIVLGARLGANLVLSQAWQEAERVVLWEPLMSGADYLAEMTRRKQIKEMMAGGQAQSEANELADAWAAGGAVDFDGFAVCRTFADELRELELAAQLRDIPAPVLLLHASGSSRLPKTWATVSEQVSASSAGSFKLIREKPFWGRLDYFESEVLIDETVAFCEGA